MLCVRKLDKIINTKFFFVGENSVGSHASGAAKWTAHCCSKCTNCWLRRNILLFSCCAFKRKLAKYAFVFTSLQRVRADTVPMSIEKTNSSIHTSNLFLVNYIFNIQNRCHVHFTFKSIILMMMMMTTMVVVVCYSKRLMCLCLCLCICDAFSYAFVV